MILNDKIDQEQAHDEPAAPRQEIQKHFKNKISCDVSTINRRRFISSSLALVAFISSGQKAVAAQTGTYFAGCFYDAAAPESSNIMRYLIGPERSRIARELAKDRGGELADLARTVLQDHPDFLKAARLNIDGSTGDPLFLGISRAMHETIYVHQQGVPDEYATVISITATLDIATDQAAGRNSNRFETVHSLLLVTNQMFKKRQPLTDAELASNYRQVVQKTLKEVVERATRELADQRTRDNAAFQVAALRFPDPLPPELLQLIETATRSDASADRAGEIDRLTRECQHLLSFAIGDELERRQRRDIALLPSPSPWASERVLQQLKTRLRLSDQPILSTPDPARMNGYEIRSAVVKTSSQVVSRTDIGQVVQVSVQAASRIVRDRGGVVVQVPSAIADPARKIGVGYGYRTYPAMEALQRQTTRDVTMGALRDAFIDLAKPTVDLILATANEINK